MLRLRERYINERGELTDAGWQAFAEEFDAVAGGGGGGGATDLGYVAATRLLTSSTGTDVTLPLASTDPGLMSAADKAKLDAMPTVLRGTATITIPSPPQDAWTQTVTAVGVTPSSRVFLSLGAMDDLQENHPEWLGGIAMGCVPGTGQITVSLGFTERQSGPVPINWSVI